jgi:hypothetical protein
MMQAGRILFAALLLIAALAIPLAVNPALFAAPCPDPCPNQQASMILCPVENPTCADALCKGAPCNGCTEGVYQMGNFQNTLPSNGNCAQQQTTGVTCRKVYPCVNSKLNNIGLYSPCLIQMSATPSLPTFLPYATVACAPGE